MKDTFRSWQTDAGAPHLFAYIDKTQLATSTGKPIAFTYYANLLYLGQFGVLEGGFRGSGVGFLPTATPEPHLVLNVHCG